MSTRPYDQAVVDRLTRQIAALGCREDALRSEVLVAALTAIGTAPHIVDGCRAVFEGRLRYRPG